MPRPARVEPDRYFRAALAILASDGAAGLKIGRLCTDLEVTSGAFYHHFGGWSGFVAELLANWEAEQTRRLLVLTATRPDPWDRIALLKRLVLTIPHEAESAIRAWSRGEPTVADAQHRVDRLRREGLHALITDIGVPEPDAHRLALMGLALLTGLQQLHSPVDNEELLSLLDEFEHTLRLRHRG